MLRGYTLIDTMIAITLSSFLVLFIAGFIREVMLYSTFFTRHQQIRQETFSIVNSVLGSVIREAVAIDYERAGLQARPGTSTKTETILFSLFMDKFESLDKRVVISLVKQASSAEVDESSQIVMDEGGKRTYLNSQKTYITAFTLDYPEHPATSGNLERLQDLRALQPMVKVKVASRYQRPVVDSRVLSFLENPRISYEAAFTLRNYSFSNLR